MAEERSHRKHATTCLGVATSEPPFVEAQRPGNAATRPTCDVTCSEVGSGGRLNLMGAPLRKPHRGKEAALDVDPRRSTRYAVTAPPDLAQKLVVAARAADLSVSGVLLELIEQMDVDAAGLPTWAESAGEGRLPLRSVS